MALIIDEDSSIGTSKRKSGNDSVRGNRGPSGGRDGAIEDDGNRLLEGSGDDVPDEEYSIIG